MKTEIVGRAGRDWTDAPRALNDEELARVRDAAQDGFLKSGRLSAIKLYRELTDATLPAAVRFVDRLREAARKS